MNEKVLLADDPRRIERVWWNGIDVRKEGCAYVTLGTMPAGLGWFVQRSDTGRWTPFDRREDALAVAHLSAKGWIPLIAGQSGSSPAQFLLSGSRAA
jgi:hypothetical protein